jgi:hypothetical protein
MKVAPVRSAGNEAKRNARADSPERAFEAMDDRNVWLLVSHIRLHEGKQPTDKCLLLTADCFLLFTTDC